MLLGRMIYDVKIPVLPKCNSKHYSKIDIKKCSLQAKSILKVKRICAGGGILALINTRKITGIESDTALVQESQEKEKQLHNPNSRGERQPVSLWSLETVSFFAKKKYS